MTTVSASSRGGKPYQLEIKARTHKAKSDVPTALGGADKAMTPHEMFLGGLAGCVADTLWMYARMKQWDLRGITVTVTETAVEDPGQPGQKIPQISEQIEITGNLTESQVSQLHAIAPRCPVSKLFTGTKQVASKISQVAPPAVPRRTAGKRGRSC